MALGTSTTITDSALLQQSRHSGDQAWCFWEELFHSNVQGVCVLFYSHSFIQPLLLEGQFSSPPAVCSWDTCPCQLVFDTIGIPSVSEAPAAARRWVSSGCAQEPSCEHGLPLSAVVFLCMLWGWSRTGWEECSRDSWVQELSSLAQAEAEHEDVLQAHGRTWTLKSLLRSQLREQPRVSILGT